MKGLWTVYKKEMRAYFVSPIPYVVIALFAGFCAYRFFDMRRFWIGQQATLEGGFFAGLEWVLIVLVPLIGMRLWSEERRGGTLESLMTYPVSTTALVVGKYFAAWSVVSLALLATCGLPFSVASLGDLDWGPVIGGYLGACLFCGALLAISIWVSSFTQHQLVAFLITLAIGFVFISMQVIADMTKGVTRTVLDQLSLTSHYQSLGRGVVDFRDVLYFASAILFFLYLNVQSIENRRYR